MGSKDWSYATKGGVIALISTLFFVIIAIPSIAIVHWNGPYGSGYYITIFNSKLLGDIIFSSYFTAFLIPIFLGVLIGWLVEKIKKQIITFLHPFL